MALYPDGGGLELTLSRFYEDERIKLTGQNVNYFWIELYKNVDPIYDEPYNTTDAAGWEYTEHPMVMAVEFVEADQIEERADEEGFVKEFDGIAYLSYLEWAANGKAGQEPKVGDVVQCMGRHFDIVKVGTGGNLVDTSDTTGWKFELRKRSKFTPERKTNP